MVRRVASVGLFLLFAPVLLAQGPAAAGEPFTATPAQLAALAAVQPVDHQFDAQVLLEEGAYHLSAEGLLTYRHHLIYRVDSPNGVANWAEISSSWDPWYEKPAQLHARVLQPGGAFVDLDQKTVTDAPIKADDAETFSSEHVRRAPLPGVAVGSIIEETEVTEEKQPFFAGGELYRFGFRWNVPVGTIRMSVELPATMPYKDAVHFLPNLKVNRSESAGVRRVVYEATAVQPGHGTDIELDTNAPTLPMVEFATGASWEAVAKNYAALSNPQTNTDDAKTLVPANLPAERMARIRAIVQKLHREVRYTGVEFGAAKLTPMRPAEVIARHYGDCKDKATLLVAMLREAGIPADLALLSTGPGRDVEDALPGMSRFDHAIVYVEPAGKEPAVWIDATAQYNEVGTLPYQDAGRMSLVISPATKGLIQIPVAKPSDSVLVETRTFTLSELGPSHVEEVSETHGAIDANYRSSYGGPDNKKTREEMEGYGQRAYLAKTLTSVTHDDGTDLEHPFHLRLVFEGAKRGFTALNEAEVVLFPTGTVNSLPKWFGQAPPVIGPDTTADTKEKLALAKQGRAESYTMRPFTAEQRARIIIPAGFTLRTLPADKTTVMGPATLTESYSSKEPGVVLATFHFDSGPGTLTPEQALALRDAVVELNKRDYVGIFLDQAGAKALAAGKIREALETDRALIAAHPADALNHVRLARALLEAGIGDEAHEEAKRATELDPKSSPAFGALGWTLEHDSLGERFGKGYDLAGAIAAYKQAVALDPDDNDTRFDLAILYEFDAHGTRYGKTADMTAAIQVYRDLIERTKDTNVQAATQYRENLMYALLYTRQFAELDKMVATLPQTSNHTVFAITSAAAQHGSAAGIAAAEKGNVASTDRNKNLRSAGTQLANLRLYREAADVMSAGIQGGDDAATVARQIELYRGLKGATMTPLPATNPAAPVQTIMAGILSGTITREQVVSVLARQAYSSPAEMEFDVKKNLASSGLLKAIAAKSDLSEGVLVDLLAGNIKYSSTGDDASGYAVIAQSPGGEPSKYFVVKEDGVFRIVADEHDFAQLGNAVLYSLGHGKPAQAKAMLDWKRDFTHKQGADDAFAGPLLPRFWTVGSTREGADSPETIRLAAISLLAGSMDAKPYLAEVSALRDKSSGARQTDLDLLLARAAVGAEQPAVALPAAKRLLEQEPDSMTALNLAAQSYAFSKDTAGWEAMLAPRLKRKPTDRELLSMQSRVLTFEGKWPAAQGEQQKVLDSGKAESQDYNSYAWLWLFHDRPGDEALKAAQQSNMMTKNGSFAELHTLACVYAAEGRTTEARHVLKQAMDAGSQTEPNSSVWYALGLIYEQYGANTAALNAYKRVQAHELDDHTYVDPVDTFVLAQQRIAALGKG